MANTFVKIAEVSVGAGGAASIDFTSIPSTYTDLVLKMSLRDSASSTRSIAKITFNGSTTSYTNRVLRGYDNGTVDSTTGNTNCIDFNYADGNTATSSTFNNAELYVPNYAGSTNKSTSLDFAPENNSSSSYILGIVAGLWSNTAAINQITITPGTANFLQYSTASLYGISKS